MTCAAAAAAAAGLVEPPHRRVQAGPEGTRGAESAADVTHSQLLTQASSVCCHAWPPLHRAPLYHTGEQFNKPPSGGPREQRVRLLNQ